MVSKQKNKKEILNDLLKQLLDQRLLKLEINNDIETKNLKLLSQDSKNIIISLEEYSNNVRKEIYLQRHKKNDYLNRNPSKMKSNKMIPKRDLLKECLSQNKVKENIYNISRNNLSKNKIYKYKNLSVPNSNNNDFNSISSYTKYNKLYVPPSKIGLTQYNTKSKLSKLSKSSSKKIYLRLNLSYSKKAFTPRIKSKKKSLIKTSGIIYSKKDSCSNFDIFSTTTATKSNTKNIFLKKEKSPKKSRRHLTEFIFGSPNSLKELNIFKNSPKPEEKKTIQNNSIRKKSILDTLSAQISKINNIKLDENLLNDELLVKEIKNSMINNDDRLLTDELLVNQNIHDINLNDKRNKIKENDKITDKINLHESKLLIESLENDDMNYILTKDEKIEDIKIKDSLTLQELFETNLDAISRYLNSKDICNVMLLNKECFKSLMNILISKTEISIDILEDEIKNIKSKNTNIDFNKIEKKPFKFSQNSMRVVPLLNACGLKITKITLEQINTYKIAVIYYLYFIASGNKKDFIQFIDNGNKMLEFIDKYFNENLKNNKMGEFIEKTINGKIFDDNTISSLYNFAHQYSGIISPNHYQIISKDLAIFVFIIRDILEFAGITGNINVSPEKEFILLNARLNNKKSLLEHLNRMDNDFC